MFTYAMDIIIYQYQTSWIAVVMMPCVSVFIEFVPVLTFHIFLGIPNIFITVTRKLASLGII